MPSTVMSGSDHTDGNDIDESKENQNGASLNNNPSQRPGFESQEKCLTNSKVQRSGTSASGPLQLKVSGSESPQSFPPNTENTSSDGKSLQSEQLQTVYEEIPAEENRTFKDELTLGDDLHILTESAPDTDPSSDESSKDCKEETSVLPCHLLQQSTIKSDGISMVVSFHEYHIY